jgi:hypothetical protein
LREPRRCGSAERRQSFQRRLDVIKERYPPRLNVEGVSQSQHATKDRHFDRLP